MNQSHGPFTNFRDIVHAAILLILVPIVFYGGYQLVSGSATTEEGDPSDIVKGVPEVLNQAKDYVLGQTRPAPGTAWLAASDRQSEILSSIVPTDTDGIEQQKRLADQLSRIREHCQKFTDEIHEQVTTETPLGQTFRRLVNRIAELQDSGSHTRLPRDWVVDFSASESERIAKLSSKVEAAYQQQAAPMRKAHAAQLSEVTRHNRELADELQRTLDDITKIERETREQLIIQQRLVAYTKDRNEIERLLKPFTTPAYRQLRDDWNDWRKTVEKKPLSFRDLERLGALSTDINGIRTFARIGGFPVHLNPNSARPLGSFPAYYDHTLSDPTKLETIKRAQQLIKQHSVYLIEAGLLQP